jgi:competence protein ComEC
VHLRKHPVIEEAVVSTLATQLMVLPLLLYQTGLLSVIAPLANVLVLPLIPVAMLLAFVTGTVGFLGSVAAFIPALLTQGLLAYVLVVAKWGTALPFAAVQLPPIPGWSVFCLYGVLALVIAHYHSAARRSPNLPMHS